MKSNSSSNRLPADAGNMLLRSVMEEYKNQGQHAASAKIEEMFPSKQKRSWEGDQVRVRLEEFLPIILQATIDRCAWLDDFEKETIVISKDLHEVLSAYQQMRRKSRAAA